MNSAIFQSPFLFLKGAWFTISFQLQDVCLNEEKRFEGFHNVAFQFAFEVQGLEHAFYL